MERDTLSFPQLAALLFGALIGPVSELLPGSAARGGVVGIICTSAAVVLMACAGIWIGILAQNGEGFAQSIKQIFGRIGGTAILSIYMVWFQFLFVLRLRLSAQRMMSGGSRDGAVWFFLFVLGGMTLWMAHGTLGALGRTAQLFFAGLILSVVGILALSLGQIEQGNLLTDWRWNGKEGLEFVWLGIQAVGYGLFGGFLWKPTEEKPLFRPWLIWCLCAVVMLMVIQIVILGCFGVTLTQAMQISFFQLSKSVEIEGAFQRMESVVAAVWIFSDLLLLTGILWSMRKIRAVLCPHIADRAVVTIAVLGGILMALSVFGGKVSAAYAAQRMGAAGNLFLGVVIPLTAVLILRVRNSHQKDLKKSEKSA